jgi:glycine/D-amino acid oxidase-like deaminating enzyme
MLTLVSDPYLFTAFLFDQAKAKGVQFVHGNATSLSIENGQVTEINVTACTDGTNLTLPCDNLVLAAGPWTGPLSETLRLPKPIPITTYAGHSLIVRPSVPVNADCLFFSVHTQNSSYRSEVLPRSSGEIYISGVNATIPLPRAPDVAMPIKAEIDKLKEIADEILTQYTIEKEQLCFRPMTDDGYPFICPLPEVRGVYVGAGHSHFGIMLGPGTGKVLSEMVLGEALSADVTQLSL